MPDIISIRIHAPSIAFTYDKKRLRKVLRAAGTEIAQAARAILRSSAGSGQMYRGGGGDKGGYRGGYKAGAYRASAPGQAPVNVTGALARSIKISPFRSGDGVAIRDAAYYAKFLEVGAQGGGGIKGARNVYQRRGGKSERVSVTGIRNLQPRPFLTLALSQREDSLRERITASVQQDIAFVRLKP